MRKIILLLLLFLSSSSGFVILSSLHLSDSYYPNYFIELEDRHWAEKMMANMNLEEKIAQLVMIRIHSNYSNDYNEKMIATIEKFKPGGVCFFQGSPNKQINLVNKIQSVSDIPLLIAIDGEWGPAMRLDSCIIFPRQMTLGALNENNDTLVYQMGVEIAEQCKALGVNINFVPCIDINNNSRNPIINSRSFGGDREEVARKGVLLMKGLQAKGVSACAKHFPGHGDTGTDSHVSLPVISKSRETLDSLELYPFRKLINEGVDMVMVSHLNIPALDPKKNSISTLSFPTITELLKKEMQFDGIVITDAMDMNALRKYYPRGGDAEIKALLAGIDILLLPHDLDIVIPAIKNAVESGTIPEELIDEKCLKVLKFKQNKGLIHYKETPTDNVIEKVNGKKSLDLINTIEAEALTLLKNNNILPLSKNNTNKIALFCIGGVKDSAEYRKMCENYGIGFVQTSRSIKKNRYYSLNQKLSQYNTIIVAMLSTNQLPNYNYGIYQEAVNYLNTLKVNKKVILSLNANPYSLSRMGNLTNYSAVIIGYQSTPSTVAATLKAVFGEGSFNGKLPVAIPNYKIHSGLVLQAAHTSQDSSFSAVSLLPESINQEIDRIINQGINSQIFPGCQVLALKNGKTIYSKSFGKLTYNGTELVTDETIYDLASVTKSAATTLAVMKLYDEGKIKLEDKIGNFLPFLSGTNKANLTIAELLTHTSGLPAFIPFYRSITDNNHYLSNTKTPAYNVPISPNLYLLDTYPDEVLKKVANCKLSEKKYVYSDLGFLLLKEIVEHITGVTLDQYLEESFYKPLGLTKTLFNPALHNIPLSQIAPTEEDKIFRKQLVHGYVHDQTAALFGGVGGNAGLFSNAKELSVIFTMLLNGGYYQGRQYISKSTVSLFTSTYPLHYCMRRGLGFDTPSNEVKSTILPPQASRKTFGHQGFTGTVVWCDPEEELVYIFLSNRVYPDVEPNKLSQSGIRKKIHEVIYRGIATMK